MEIKSPNMETAFVAQHGIVSCEGDWDSLFSFTIAAYAL